MKKLFAPQNYITLNKYLKSSVSVSSTQSNNELASIRCVINIKPLKIKLHIVCENFQKKVQYLNSLVFLSGNDRFNQPSLILFLYIISKKYIHSELVYFICKLNRYMCL